jgi:hypothetical protein
MCSGFSYDKPLIEPIWNEPALIGMKSMETPPPSSAIHFFPAIGADIPPVLVHPLTNPTTASNPIPPLIHFFIPHSFRQCAPVPRHTRTCIHFKNTEPYLHNPPLREKKFKAIISKKIGSAKDSCHFTVSPAQH